MRGGHRSTLKKLVVRGSRRRSRDTGDTDIVQVDAVRGDAPIRPKPKSES